MKKLLLILFVFTVACTGTNSNETLLINLHKEYINGLKIYNESLSELVALKKLDSTIKRKIQKIYFHLKSIKNKMLKTTVKLKSLVSKSTKKQLLEIRKKIRLLLNKKIKLQNKIKNINGVDTFFENMFLRRNSIERQ